jgi:hypothetical protein
MRTLSGVCTLLFAALAAVACTQTPEAMPIDASIDGAPNPCDACTTDQICVAKYDGTCRADIACVTRVAQCANNTCTPGCEAAYCNPRPLQCLTRTPCGGEPPGAFTCYGP